VKTTRNFYNYFLCTWIHSCWDTENWITSTKK